jgi:histone demethylase JARID1
MEGATRSTMSYLDKLAKFHRQQGTTLTRLPSLDKQPIDLYQLKRAVDIRGGFKAVCAAKKWAEIGREMGYGSIKNITSVSTALKNAFQKFLLPYETYLEKAKPDFLREMGLTPSPHQDKPKRDTPSKSPLAIRRNLMEKLTKSEDQQVEDLVERIMDEAAREDSVKVESVVDTDYMRDATPSPPHNGLKRAFEESTVRSTSISTENEKDSETNRRESKRLKKGIPLGQQSNLESTVPTVVGSNMAQHAHVVKPSRMGAMVAASPIKKPGENCEICGRGDCALSMLLCDGCDTGYHTFCLDPPLKVIPKFDWYCAQCLVGTNEFGFEDGEEYSLGQFQEKANAFRKDYIQRKLRPNGGEDVSETEVEAEFWRMVSNVQETIEVDYGADIHSTTHGSGFPTVETNPTDPYATDPWNLNVMPLDNNSLFRHIKSDVSGMTVPWLYVGMMFSTFCWHNEDHYCYSINYQHFGATKTWYGIPGSDADKFELAMKNAVPELFETQPDLLFQLVTMLSPERLVEEGVSVYAVDQRPNQFVITFPQAYHAGFNHGV